LSLALGVSFLALNSNIVKYKYQNQQNKSAEDNPFDQSG
jgi:hypothetical protein